MNKNRVFTGVSILLFIVLIPQLLLQTGCANIIPPLGGPRDTLPPVVVTYKPADSSKNFKDGRIVFTFDEYVEIQDVQKNLIVSPTPRINPAVDRKLNTIIVKLKDTLEPNTTYSLNFGNSIKDLNEGNILRNFTYLFTTGKYFDSLQFSGKVFLAKTGDVDTTVAVLLYRNLDDSAIVKDKPRYVAKLDKAGNFTFKNLPSGTFALFGMKDEGSFRFSGRDQLFAFADKPVVLGKGPVAPVTMYAFPDNEGAATAVPTRKRGTTSKEKRLVITNSLDRDQQDLLQNLILTFDTPLKTLDSTKITVATDSAFNPLTDYQLITDSTNKTLTFKTTWKEETTYHLIFAKDFATDTLGKQLLRPDTITFKTKGAKDYGNIKIRFKNLDLKKNPVLLIMRGDNNLDSSAFVTTEFNKKVFPPGEYQLRILYDNNKNGKWDPGQYYGDRRQPELIKTIEQKITIKANWDNELEVDVNAPPMRKPTGAPAPGPRRVTQDANPPIRPTNQ